MPEPDLKVPLDELYSSKASHDHPRDKRTASL